MKKNYIIILSLLFLLSVNSQTNSREYFCKKVKLDSIKITENKTLNFNNAKNVKIIGKTVDINNIGVEETEIKITNLNTKESKIFETNENGLFDINIVKGFYSIMFRKNSYGKINVESSEFLEGQIQEININFGSKISYVSYQIIQGETFTIEKPKKKKKPSAKNGFMLGVK